MERPIGRTVAGGQQSFVARGAQRALVRYPEAERLTCQRPGLLDQLEDARRVTYQQRQAQRRVLAWQLLAQQDGQRPPVTGGAARATRDDHLAALDVARE